MKLFAIVAAEVAILTLDAIAYSMRPKVTFETPIATITVR